jgi:hypothetical protein
MLPAFPWNIKMVIGLATALLFGLIKKALRVSPSGVLIDSSSES